MTLPTLVSFSGYPRSGKDAAADLLVSRARFAKTYMLKPLEKTMLRVNPWIVDHKENTIERFSDLHENLGFDATREFEEARRLIQLGTEVGRDLLGRNIWTELVFDEVQSLRDSGKNVAISGVEYLEELPLVREYGGVCVWIDRYNVRPGKYQGTVRPEDCDLVVANNGTLKDFYIALIVSLEEYQPAEES